MQACKMIFNYKHSCERKRLLKFIIHKSISGYNLLTTQLASTITIPERSDRLFNMNISAWKVKVYYFIP